MKIIQNIDDIPRVKNPVVTIGTFDGIHLGHQRIIEELISKKINRQGHSFLITFDPHPQLVLRSRENPIKIITSYEEKLEILKEFDLDYLIVLQFTPELSRMSGKEFIEEILVKRIGLIDVVIGYDHAFGHRRSGNIQMLKEMGDKFNFLVHVVQPFYYDNVVVKSSLIRQKLLSGEVDSASKILGRLYSISGIVVEGKGRGRKLSFPTANVMVENPHKLVPGDGIYAIYARIHGERIPGVVSIGVRPTFNEHDRSIEAYLFDFDKNIYGENLTIEFVKKIRDEEKFDNVDLLINQMGKDVEHAKKILV